MIQSHNTNIQSFSCKSLHNLGANIYILTIHITPKTLSPTYTLWHVRKYTCIVNYLYLISATDEGCWLYMVKSTYMQILSCWLVVVELCKHYLLNQQLIYGSKLQYYKKLLQLKSSLFSHSQSSVYTHAQTLFRLETEGNFAPDVFVLLVQLIKMAVYSQPHITPNHSQNSPLLTFCVCASVA